MTHLHFYLGLLAIFLFVILAIFLFVILFAGTLLASLLTYSSHAARRDRRTHYRASLRHVRLLRKG